MPRGGFSDKTEQTNAQGRDKKEQTNAGEGLAILRLNFLSSLAQFEAFGNAFTPRGGFTEMEAPEGGFTEMEAVHSYRS